MASQRKDAESVPDEIVSEEGAPVSREEFSELVKRVDELYAWAKNGQVWS